MKKLIVFILLAGVLTMNTSMFCQSLCMADGGHGDKSHGHTSHHQGHKESGQTMPQGAMCPADHADHCTHNNAEESSIKCHCSAGNDSSSAYETALIIPVTDVIHVIQAVSSMDITPLFLSSRASAPLTEPPEFLS